ncbi:hypothetical protein [Caldovatus aquaticus]|uniref:Uncharacterized protein n=1 Tax=Caldovatus aquaticus TaxID=2865671 RepID=A0ABS7EYV0_9PROT|nr:hypothetical protein [Caldovatus aquaticus]MBW8268542.1 hypothetical protein [Caldovatus aquaticus]
MMSSAEALRLGSIGGAPSRAGAADASPGPDPALPRLAAFRSGDGGGGEDRRLSDLLAYALAVEAHEAALAAARPPAPLTPEAIRRLRDQAARQLHDHAFRFLHNRVEEIRAEAIAEHLGRHPRPPGLPRLVLANLIALALAALAAAWLQGHPETLAGLLAAFGG